MNDESPVRERAHARVELAFLNLHPSGDLVIAGLGKGIDGRWELPGTWVMVGESPVEAARRIISEVFGQREILHQPVLVGVRSTASPEASMTVLFAYFGLVPNTVREWSGFERIQEWGDLTEERFSAGSSLVGVGDVIVGLVAELPVLARALASSRSLDVFTLSELREVYEKVLGFVVDAPNFRRKVLAARNFLEEISVEESEELKAKLPMTLGKPPQRYRCGPANRLDPPVRFEARFS